MMGKVLCQDCLRVEAFTPERHQGTELCDCGGEYCGCHACEETIKKLEQGERQSGALGLRAGVCVIEWTSAEGAKVSEGMA